MAQRQSTTSQRPREFDLVILGAGSSAFAAALKAVELSATTAMTEAWTIGGTCVNRGCIPSKILIAAAELYHSAKTSRFPGVELAQKKLDFRRLMRQKDELVEELRQKKYQDIVDGQAEIAYFAGTAQFISKQQVQVGDQLLTGRAFLVATGGRPVLPDIPGLADIAALDSTSIFELQALPKSLVIIGGGFIALELGQAFARFGSQVTVLERGPRVLRGFEPEIAETVQYFLSEEGVTIHTQVTFQRVYQDGQEKVVEITRDGATQKIRGEQVLVAVGRRPNTEDLGLEQAGVELNQDGYVQVDAELRTTASHVYAAGDVTGPPLATPVGARAGVIAAENALNGAHRQMDYTVIPRAVFTDPEVGAVGLSEPEAVAAGYRCSCRVLDLAVVPKAAAIRDTRGVVKMVADGQTQRILGVQLAMPRGADIIHEAALAVRCQLTLQDLIDTIHVYPTLSEALRMVAQSFTRDVRQLSCCAE